ncbi:MAG: hypothetical protein IT561_11505 [Alphaproteobacteria bacterium]|nr:hypothetical protein [Alphaproteobacteria bacterium]
MRAAGEPRRAADARRSLPRPGVRPGAALVLSLLAACAQPPPEQAATTAMQEALSSHQASLAGLGATPLAVPAEETQLVATAASTGGAAPPLAGRLVGQTPEGVLQWLGEPRLRRAEGAAEIWHYQASHCHLDLVLYPDEGSRQSLRVAFAAARAAGAVRRGEAACLADIARGATRPGPPALAGQARAGA